MACAHWRKKKNKFKMPNKSSFMLQNSTGQAFCQCLLQSNFCFHNVISPPLLFSPNPCSHPHSRTVVSQDVAIRSRRVLSALSTGAQKVRLNGKMKAREPARGRASAQRLPATQGSACSLLHRSQKPLLRLEFLQLL